jgi:hypothetical protein
MIMLRRLAITCIVAGVIFLLLGIRYILMVH